MLDGWTINDLEDDGGWTVNDPTPATVAPKDLPPPAIKPYSAPMKEVDNGWIINGARKIAEVIKADKPIVPVTKAVDAYLNPKPGTVVSAGHGGTVSSAQTIKATPADEDVVKTVKGAVQGAGELGESLTTPTNVMIGGAMLIPGVAPVAGLYFTYDMMKSAVETAPQVKEAWDRGDKQEAARLAVHTLGSAYFSKKGAEHLANGARPVVEQMRQKPGMVPMVKPKFPAVPSAEKPVEVASPVRPMAKVEAPTAPTPLETPVAKAELFTGSLPPTKPLWEMTRDEIADYHKKVVADDKNIEVSLFGEEGAKAYNRAQRTANSSMATPERADAAQAVIEQMEGALTESQRNKLYGIGDNPDAVPDVTGAYADAIKRVDTSSPAEAAFSIKWALTKIGDATDPAKMDLDQRVAYATLNTVFRESAEKGYDINSILKDGLSQASERWKDPADAAFMLKRFMKPEEAEPSVSLPMLEAPPADSGWTINPPSQGNRSSARGATQLGALRFTPFGKPKPPVVEDYMNFDRLKITPEERGRLQGEYEKFMGDNPQFRRSNAEVIERAKELSPEQVDAAVRGDSASGNLQHDAAAYAVRQRINTLNGELYKMEGELQRQGLTMDEAAKSELESVIQSKNAELNEYMTKAEKSRSAAGRTLQMYNAMADNGFDFASWNGVAKRAMRLKPDQPLPPDVAKGIREAVGKGQEAEASGDPAKIKTAKVELATKVAKLHESSWWEMISALTKATILTGAKTHERNMIGNAVFAGMEEVSRIPAAITDVAVSTFTKRRTVSGASLKAMRDASATAATQGVAEAKQVMMTGMSEADLVKGELPRELNFQGLGKASEVINVFTNTVFRALSAEDRLFKAYAIRRSIDAQANVMAINEARSGVITKAEIKSRAAELSQNPTEGMAVQSILDGDFATFNNRNNLAKAVDAGKISLERNAPPFKLAADLVVPFVRTPLNIVARLFDYSPAGAAWGTGKAITQTAVGKLKTRRVEKKGGTPAEIQKALDAEFTPKQQKSLAEAIGRGSTGSAILLAGYLLGKKGLATGTDVAPIGERQADDYIGKQPGSAYFNGRWWRIDSFAPGGALFAIGATLANEPSQWKKPVSFGAKVGVTAAKTMLETPMLKGAKDVVDSLAAPDQRAPRLLGSLVSRVVPTAVSDIASAMDPYKRDMTKNPISSRIPFLRNKLEPRLDAFGQPMENIRSNSFDPTLSKPDRRLTDPLAREMDRVGVSVSPMKPGVIYTVIHPDGRSAEYESQSEAKDVADELELDGMKPKVTQSQEPEARHRLRQELVGPLMKQYAQEAIADPEYQGMTDNQKKKAIESAIRDARAQMAELISEPDFVALSPEQQIQYLTTLRDRLNSQRK